MMISLNIEIEGITVMFDNEKLMAALTAYKQYFPLHWKDEKYKWEAVQYFQNNWDIEAENFLDMFMKATDKTFNLLASMNNYPRAMIRAFAEKEPETVRDMFIVLYDETRNLDERIEKFEMMAEDLRVRYDDGSWKHHYQSANAISTYLWLRYPDKYFIYPMRRKTPCFSYGDIRRVHRIYASN